MYWSPPGSHPGNGIDGARRGRSHSVPPPPGFSSHGTKKAANRDLRAEATRYPRPAPAAAPSQVGAAGCDEVTAAIGQAPPPGICGSLPFTLTWQSQDHTRTGAFRRQTDRQTDRQAGQAGQAGRADRQWYQFVSFGGGPRPPPPKYWVRPPQWCSRPPQSLKDVRAWNGLDQSAGLIIESSP